MTYYLKCDSEPLMAIEFGLKTFEFRKDDRGGYQVGDLLILQCDESGLSIPVQVVYIIRCPSYGIPDGYCAMSVRKVLKSAKEGEVRP